MTDATALSNGKATCLIPGVEVRRLRTNRQASGELTALEEDCNLGFPLRRVFYIRPASPESVRAEHASSDDMVMIALTGGVTVDVDNGHQKDAFRLEGTAEALWIRPGVWVRLRNFVAGTVILVASSREYAETRHYDTPQPHLIPGI